MSDHKNERITLRVQLKVSETVTTVDGKIETRTKTARTTESLGLEPGFAGGRLTVGAVVADGLFDVAGALKDDVIASINGVEITGQGTAVLLIFRSSVFSQALCFADNIMDIRRAASLRDDVFELVVLRDRSKEDENKRDSRLPADLAVNMQMQLGRPRCEKCASCGRPVVEDVGFIRYHCLECDMTDW